MLEFASEAIVKIEAAGVVSLVIRTALNLQRAAFDNYIVAPGWDCGAINQRKDAESQDADGGNGDNQ
jgi:hypothetical protein